MDILKPKSKYPWKYLAMAGASIVILLLLACIIFWPQDDYKIERSKLLIGTVQRGELQVIVEGYGVLRSDKQVLITALMSATVQEVLLRSGAQVEADSVILKLNSPELLQEVDTADKTLVQEQANLRRLKLNNQRELLAEQATLAELVGGLKVAQLRSQAEKSLAGGAVSMMTYKTTLLQEDLMTQRVQLQSQRVTQLKDVMHESLIIQQEQINRATAIYQNLQQRAEHLTVRAGQKGVLQRLSVDLGQSITLGQELALVGSDKDLKALILVSQSKAEQVKIGQLAQINTRREQVAGIVTRVAPGVKNGTIEVEVAFSEGVPVSARPELNVDARIFISSIKDTLFIERPLNAQSHTNSQLFRLDKNSKAADVQQLSFGDDSDRFIQIKSGASEKDRFILSDMTSFREAKKIQLIN